MDDVARRLDTLRRLWLEQPGISGTLPLMGLTDINQHHITNTLTDLSRMAEKLGHAAPADMVMTRLSGRGMGNHHPDGDTRCALHASACNHAGRIAHHHIR